MDSVRWQRVRAVFELVVDLPIEQWENALLSASPDDAELRAEALAMLNASRDDGSYMSETGLAGLAPDLVGELADGSNADEVDYWLDRRIGAWRVVRVIGQGGMGMVYLAERGDDQFEQRAAIKITRPGTYDRRIAERFLVERQILAGLEHPNIARLLDGGVVAGGSPWFAMEYVEGEMLTRYCDIRANNIRERLTLFLAICDAIVHAHQRLVVHRDLKPSNILVDQQGHVKLLDFGIAKLLDPEANTAQTGTALHLFTPEYAAPEQVRGEIVTTAVDIYALGLILFELLTGRCPYQLAHATPLAVLQAVLVQESPRPSSVVTQPAPRLEDSSNSAEERALRRGLTPPRLRARLQGDLDAIVNRALRKEPSHRYASVRDLADDVRAVLDRRPVAARQGGLRYRCSRFLRRHALETVLVAITGFALIAGLLAALWQADRAEHERAIAQGETRKAQAVTAFMVNLFNQGDPTRTDGIDPKASELLAKGARDLEAKTDLDDATRAAMLTSMGRAYLSIQDSEQAYELLKHADRSARASGDGRAQVEAAATLARSLIVLDRHEDAGLQLERSRELLKTYGIEDGKLENEIDLLNGVSLLNQSRLDDALHPMRRAFGRLANEAAGSEEQARLIEVYTTILIDTHHADEAVQTTTAAYEAANKNAALPVARRANFAAASGTAYMGAGRFIEAEQRFRENLALMEQIYGLGHLGTTTALNNIGLSLRRQGKFADASAYAERVLAIRRSHLPEGNHLIVRSIIALGIIYSEGSDPEHAIPLLYQGLKPDESTGDIVTPTTINAQLALTRSLEQSGDFTKAMILSGNLLPFVDAPDSNFPSSIASDFRLRYARLHARLNLRVEDCSFFDRVISTDDSTPIQRVEGKALKANCEFQAGRVPQARDLVREIHLEHESELDAINSFTLTILSSLPD